MEFPSLNPNNNYIYIKFATLKSNALLMYNHDNQTGDKAEFLALEILEGRVRFSFNLGSGTYKLMTMMRVSDGQFHTVIARRAGMVRSPFPPGRFLQQKPGFVCAKPAQLMFHALQSCFISCHLQLSCPVSCNRNGRLLCASKGGGGGRKAPGPRQPFYNVTLQICHFPPCTETFIGSW